MKIGRVVRLVFVSTIFIFTSPVLAAAPLVHANALRSHLPGGFPLRALARPLEPSATRTEFEKQFAAIDSEDPDDRAEGELWFRRVIDGGDFKKAAYVETLLKQKKLSVQQQRSLGSLLKPWKSETMGEAIVETIRDRGKQLAQLASQVATAQVAAVRSTKAYGAKLEKEHEGEKDFDYEKALNLAYVTFMKAELKKASLSVAGEGTPRGANWTRSLVLRDDKKRFFRVAVGGSEEPVSNVVEVEKKGNFFTPKIATLEPGVDIPMREFRRQISPLLDDEVRSLKLGRIEFQREPGKAAVNAAGITEPAKESTSLSYQPATVGKADYKALLALVKGIRSNDSVESTNPEQDARRLTGIVTVRR